MTISSPQSPAVGDVKTAAALTALHSAKTQQASLVQLFDPAKAVPEPRKSAKSESDTPPPPPKDSGRGRVVDQRA